MNNFDEIFTTFDEGNETDKDKIRIWMITLRDNTTIVNIK